MAIALILNPGKLPKAFALSPKFLLATVICVYLTACGGGGFDASAGDAAIAASAGGGPGTATTAGQCTPPPEGVQPFATETAAVGGSIVGRTDPSIILLQSPDTTGRGFDRIMIYGPDLAATSLISGVVYAGGGVSCSVSDLTSYNGTDYGRGGERVHLRTAIGDSFHVQNLIVGGSLRDSTGSFALAPAPLPGIDPGYTLSSTQLTNAVGPWSLHDTAAVDLSLDVAADGEATLHYKGCTLKGTLRVADAGLYAITAKHETSSCADSNFHNETYEGVVLAYPLTTGGWQLVISLSANNGVDGDSLLAIGRR